MIRYQLPRFNLDLRADLLLSRKLVETSAPELTDTLTCPPKSSPAEM